MGKNRHSKDKLYIVASEYQRDWGGAAQKESQLPFRCLPFDCCCLSLLPFETPVCTKNGVVFDAKNIFAYIDKYHRNPVTGSPLSKKDLIPLRFHKNNDGRYHCPVTYKEFNNYSFIVANAKTGHVYSNDAIDSLCRRPKNWNDLITNEPFTSNDLVIIQNPRDVENRKIEEFDYIKSGISISLPKTASVKGVAADEGSLDPYMKKTELTLNILEKSKEREEETKHQHNQLIPNVNYEEKKCSAILKDPIKTESTDIEKPTESVAATTKLEHAVKEIRGKNIMFTTHRQAASFTSTAVDVAYDAEFRDFTDKETRLECYKAVRKSKANGYVSLITSLGALNFEVYCSKVPQTCDNFLRHCESGYFKNTIFHRSIPNFMIQGGDPTGTGAGGQSAFEDGLPFEDEFHPHLVHKGMGILSMANSGRHTNKSQFFITYKSCEHLNNAHSVFGRVVGGLDTLKSMEGLPTNDDDKPLSPPKILDTIVFKNPFRQFWEEQQKKIKEEEEKKSTAHITSMSTTDLIDPMRHHKKRHISEIGKYTDPLTLKNLKKRAACVATTASSKAVTVSTTLDPNIQKKKLLFEGW